MLLSDEILGRWLHSHEESTKEMVFRPAGTPLPPSRGRMALELRPDGTFVEGSPGPDDRSRPAAGQWSLDGEALRLSYSDDRPDQIYGVTRAEGKLVLAPHPR